MVSIRRIHSNDGALFRDIRLSALKDSPHAFCSTYESALERTIESWDEQAESSATGNSRSTFLAFQNESPIGIAALYQDKECSDHAEVLQVWVDPKHRGTAIAKRLIDALVEWARLSGFVRITATVTKVNERATKFYLNYGFSLSEKQEGDIVLYKLIKTTALESGSSH